MFTHHYVQVPTCGASRYSLLTGRSPKYTGATKGNNHFYNGNNRLHHEKTDGAQSMPELFRRNGYHTVNIGKMSHTADGLVYNYDATGDGREEMPHAWDELATPLGDWERGWGVFFAYANGRHREDGKGNQDLMEFVVEQDTDLPDGLNAEAAIAKLTELKDRDEPFFMGLGFYKPHLPFVAPREDWEAMKKVEVADATLPAKPDSAFWHESGEFYKYDTPYEKSNPLAKDDRITARRAYGACVRYVDRQVGKVLDALEELGLAESTIVVVWGDHGWQLGESALWGKHVAHERALKSALLMRVPGAKANGQISDALVQTIDLYPTLIDLCTLENTETEHSLNGKSLRPIVDAKTKTINDVAISYWGDSVSVRDAQYRLIAKKGEKGQHYTNVELYDAEASPDPTRNLAKDEPGVVKRLMGYITRKEQRP